jgi:hypothetical protein
VKRLRLRRLALLATGTLIAVVAALPAAHAEDCGADDTGSVSGAITDNGAPVAGALVQLLDNTPAVDTHYAFTDENGRHEVTRVPVAGSPYALAVEAKSHQRQYAHSSLDQGWANRFSVVGGQSTVIDEEWCRSPSPVQVTVSS